MYTVEISLDECSYQAVRRIGEAVRSAAAELSEPDREVRVVRVIQVLELCSCLVLVEAPSAATARKVVRKAGLAPGAVKSPQSLPATTVRS